MITPTQIAAATTYAREKDSTFPGVRRFLEALLENADRAETANRRGFALDAVPRTSHFMDPECTAAADAIWESIQPPSPSSYFEGVPYGVGMAKYQASLKVWHGQPKSKEVAYV